MYKYSIFITVAIFCCVQCLPLDASHSESTSTSQLDIVVSNSTQSTNRHPSPVMSELETIEEEIDSTLQDILPFLSLFFDSLFGDTKPADDGNDCVNDMATEVHPDDTAMTLQPNEETDKKSQPEDKSGPNSDTANTEAKSVGKSDDKPVTNPDVVSTPEEPVDNVQTNP